MSTAYLELTAVLALIAVNGFFALSEMALVASRRARLRTRAEAGDAGAALALDLLREPERFLSAVQIGVTLIGVVTGALGGAALADRLALAMTGRGVPGVLAQALAFAAAVLPIALLTLILGELVPKRLACARPEALAARTAPAMALVMRLAHPLVTFLSLSTRTVLRLVGLDPGEEPSLTEADIRAMILEGERLGVLDQAERDRLERVFRLGDRSVAAVMTHRSKIVWLDADASLEQALARVRETSFSRFPVARGGLANILGVLKARDFLASRPEGERFEPGPFLRPPLYVPESTRLPNLLELFKKNPGTHLALIVDEYGSLEGLVTLDDVLDSLVGDIPAEGEEAGPGAVRRPDGSWIMDALLPLDEAAALLGIERRLPGESVRVRTLAGYLLSRLGRIPKIGAVVEEHGWRFEVADMDGKRIDAVLVTPAAGKGAQDRPGGPAAKA